MRFDWKDDEPNEYEGMDTNSYCMVSDELCIELAVVQEFVDDEQVNTPDEKRYWVWEVLEAGCSAVDGKCNTRDTGKRLAEACWRRMLEDMADRIGMRIVEK